MSGYETCKAVASLIDGADLCHTGGNCWAIQIVNPNFGRETYYFGTECGDVVGFDREIDGELMNSGDLRVSADADPATIAAEIGKFMAEGPKYLATV